ncbi:MAG: LysM peptidoglycan-binding domain-containing protein [Candidatus Omnitrophota bacterium]
MKKQGLFYLSGLCFALVLSGCVVRTYPLVKERVDQDLTTGNHGYLMGQAPASTGAEKERKTTRTTRVVEIELGSPIKFEKTSKRAVQSTVLTQETTEQTTEGNRGYITQSIEPQTIAEPSYENYTVQKGDTLQKISKKFYGTTKNWTKIYDANRDTLKGPNKVYPGRTIKIPAGPELRKGVEPLMEPKENLK